jgi:hypothetical protein
LSGLTAEVLHESGAEAKTTWAAIDHPELRKVFAVPSWREKVGQEADGAGPNVIGDFILDQCSSVLMIVENALRRNI